MTNYNALKSIYKQNLESRIIEYLASIDGIGLRTAMDIYYKSRLCVQIENEEEGIENLDYKYLALDLIENEPELIP